MTSSIRTHTTRRAILQSALAAVAAGAARAATAHWKPKLGIYCRYSTANIDFAAKEGFTCLQLATGGPISPDSTDEQLAEVKRPAWPPKCGLAQDRVPGDPPVPLLDDEAQFQSSQV